MVSLYVDCRGVRYRVHDAVYGVAPAALFKRMRVPLGDGRAKKECGVSGRTELAPP